MHAGRRGLPARGREAAGHRLRGVPHPRDLRHASSTTRQSVYPGVEELGSFAEVACLEQFEPFVGTSAFDSTLSYSWLVPTLGSWNDEDDREVLCVLSTRDGAPLVGQRAVVGRLTARPRSDTVAAPAVQSPTAGSPDTEGGVRAGCWSTSTPRWRRSSAPPCPQRTGRRRLLRAARSGVERQARRAPPSTSSCGTSGAARAGPGRAWRRSSATGSSSAGPRCRAVELRFLRHGVDVGPRRRAGPALRADAGHPRPRGDPRDVRRRRRCEDAPAADAADGPRRATSSPTSVPCSTVSSSRGSPSPSSRPSTPTCSPRPARRSRSSTCASRRRDAGRAVGRSPSAASPARSPTRPPSAPPSISPRGVADRQPGRTVRHPRRRRRRAGDRDRPATDGRRAPRGRRARDLTCAPSSAPSTSRSRPATSRSSRSRWPTRPT